MDDVHILMDANVFPLITWTFCTYSFHPNSLSEICTLLWISDSSLGGLLGALWRTLLFYFIYLYTNVQYNSMYMVDVPYVYDGVP